MIEIRQVTKYYDDFLACKDLNMSVKKGSIYGLVGPNGAGKTTLLRMLSGVIMPDTGEISILDQPILENNQAKQRVQFIPDELYFLPLATAKSMAKYYERRYGSFSWERYHKIKEVLAIDENKRLAKLSKGMKKQVAFWLAIASRPDVMVLDEPVDGLDPVMRKQIWSILMQDVANRDMTVLISSHNLRELEDVCDYVGIIHQGEIILERDLDQLKDDIHKVQFAADQPVESLKLDVLKEAKVGSVRSYIVRGSKDEIEKNLRPYAPYFIDFIPLTLEEIFIYEIGGVGYETKNLIL